jgi:ferredoxin
MQLNEHPTVIRYREKAAAQSPPLNREKIDADRLKSLALEAGADDAAIVELDRPEINDQRADILEIFPRTKSLVSLVCKMNRENIRCPSRDISDLEFLRTFEKINETARRLAGRLEADGIRTLYLSGGFPMNMAKWPGKMWPVSHKTIAEAGGLGKIGHHRLVIHPRFGSFIVLGTILLDREATAYDQPLDYNPCVECRLCVAVCPVGAIAADGHFNFTACLTHNYRDRLGGFQDWVERVVTSRNVADYRRKVGDPETTSMWQSLSYGICNKSSYCLAVCPAGEEVIGPFLDNRQSYQAEVVKPFQDKEETIYVVPGSDAEKSLAKRFPHKKAKLIGNGLRAGSAKSFLESLPLIFQREQSEGLNATYHFTFTGDEALTGTAVIQDKQISVLPGHVGKADLQLTADSRTWVDFLAKEKGLLPALIQRKIRIKGSPRLMKQFARCFPS